MLIGVLLPNKSHQVSEVKPNGMPKTELSGAIQEQSSSEGL